MVTNGHGGPAGDSETIVIGNDIYDRFGTRPWQKDTYNLHAEIPFAGLSAIVYDSGLKLVRREMIGGSITFVYENKYHPGGVSIRKTTDDIWIGANDHRLLKVQTLFTETPPFTGSTIERYTVTCAFGPVPEITPPI